MKKAVSLLLSLMLILSLAVSAFAAGPYPDVAADAWYAPAVTFLRDHKIMQGTEGGNFEPARGITRAAFAAILYRTVGSPEVSGTLSFTDTDPNAWYAPAVLWCTQQGLVRGYEDGSFHPTSAVTQEQVTTIAWRAAGARELDREKYASEEGIENQASDYAFDAIVWAKAEALIHDLDSFAPHAPASRAQTADMLYRYIKNIGLPEEFSGAIS